MYCSDADVPAVQRAVERLAPGSDEVVVVLLAERGAPPLDVLARALAPLPGGAAGGLYPALIDGRHLRESGFIAFSVPSIGAPVVVRGLGPGSFSLPDLAVRLPEPSAPRPTVITLVDGLAANLSLLLSRCYGQLGNAVSWLGGGAGSASLTRRPCLFTGEGPIEDGAVLVFTPWESRPGVHHGWRPIGAPIAATRTDRNRLVELNWRPAFDVYREAIEQSGGPPVTRETFLDVARGHPFGLVKEGQEDVVRDPLTVEPDGALVCVGEVPQNAVVSVMTGDPDALVRAAGAAAANALHASDVPARLGLVMDCVSRVVFLGDRFTEEIDEIERKLRAREPEVPVVGALTLGEIASQGDGYLEFFNKTAVVGVLRGRS